MQKTKILMIVSHFYPEGSIVEAKNNYLTLLELEKSGFKVDVCTYESNKKYPSNVKYFVPKNNKIFSRKNKYYNFLRTKIKMPLLPIDFSNTKDFFNVIDKVDMNQYKYIYTVFGNGSEHIVGVKLKQKYPHLKHIAEFRDPWVHNKIAKEYFFNNSFKLYANYYWKKLWNIEKELISKVDLLLVESSSHIDWVKKDFKYDKEILICNGYSKQFFEKELNLSIEFNSKPVIGFVGNTYYGHDYIAKTFIEVLKELENEGVEFTFISIGDNFFSKESVKSDMKNFYALHKIPYIKALSFIKKIDLGLALIMESYDNINSKIFEYMQYKKYIIAFAPKGGAMELILSKTKSGEILSYDKKRLKEQLKEIITNYHNRVVDKDKIKIYSREEVFKPIIKAIKEL